MKNHLVNAKPAIFTVALLLLATFSSMVWGEIAVITNPASGVGSLSKSDVKAIFLGKKSTFPNGNAMDVVDQEDGSATKEAFIEKVLGKNSAQLAAYWSQQIFSGKGTPPKTKADDAAVKAFVAATPGAIGYIDSSQVDNSVSVVYTAR